MTTVESEGTLLTIQSKTAEGEDWYVRLRPDGTLDYSDSYTPDDAARALWESVALHSPRCTCGALTPPVTD